MRAVLIVNPKATTTTPQTRAALVSALEQELDLKVFETTHRGHAAELAEAVRDEVELVIAHGGDGTVSELVGGLLGPADEGAARPADSLPAVAVIPGGSANVFARSLGISPDPSIAVEQLLVALRSGQRRRISAGVCDNRWFICNAGLGIDADVIATVESERRAGRAVTPARYFRATVTSFFRWVFRPGLLTLQIPGRPPVTGVRIAFVSNCTPWTYLGDRPIITNPGIDHAKGLGVFATTKLGLLRGIPLAIAMLSPSKTPDTPGVIREDDLEELTLTCENPLRCQIDGEYVGRKRRAVFRSAPDVLDVIAPGLLPN